MPSILSLFSPVRRLMAQTASESASGHPARARIAAELARLGLGRLRLSPEQGGLGADVPELFALLIDLSSADPDSVQAWRTHILVTERYLIRPGADDAHRWLERIASGAMIGGGWTEPGATGTGSFETRLAPDPSGAGWRLDGTKSYSTGSLFADWLEFSAVLPDDRYTIAGVPADAPGVELRDDWTGFGQRFTASGTTVLRDVPVHADDLIAWDAQHPGLGGWQQAVLLAVLAGIAQGAAEVSAEALRRAASRREAPAPDETALGAYGRIAATAFSVRATVLELARALQHAHDSLLHARSAHRVGESAARGDGEDARHGEDGEAAEANQAGQHDAAHRSAAAREAVRAADLASAKAHSAVLPQVIEAASAAAGLASSLGLLEELGADRYWRNARTLGTHNPVMFKERLIADAELLGLDPSTGLDERVPARERVWARLRGTALTAVGVPVRAAAELASDPALRHQAAEALDAEGIDVLVLSARSGQAPSEGPVADSSADEPPVGSDRAARATGTTPAEPVFDPSIAAAVLIDAFPGRGLLLHTRGVPPGELAYNFARRLATLEHLSDGRTGWWLDIGDPELDPEFLVTVQQLLVSWPLDSLAEDRDAPHFADVAPIRRVNRGGAFPTAGPLNVPSSPQGLPLMIVSGQLPWPGSAAQHYTDALADRPAPVPAATMGAQEWLDHLGEHAFPLPAPLGSTAVAEHDDVTDRGADDHAAGGSTRSHPPAPSRTWPGPATLRGRLGLAVPLLAPLPSAEPRFDLTDDADRGAL